MKTDIPYYKGSASIEVPDDWVKAVLTPQSNNASTLSEAQTVKNALLHPIESDRLSDLAAGKTNILIITSDHTRPMPSRITMPLLLSEVREGAPNAHIKILIATGFHRQTTDAELKDRFGDAIAEAEDIIVHNAFDEDAMVSKGTLPSGGELKINRLVDWADLIAAEGFIEPHFFAGFSGGRKSILPGICAKSTIMYNHNAEFIGHPCARTGVLQNNPLHQDMLYASQAVGLKFILNVTLDADKKISGAYAGHPVAAHAQGCEKIRSHARAAAVKADIVITSNGGYPLDQNIYQAVKGIDTASRCVKPSGVILMFSSCVDGHGGEGFYQWFIDAASPLEVVQRIEAMPRDRTRPDQWEAQILARVLNQYNVIMITQHADPKLIRDMHMIHANTFEEAMQTAQTLIQNKEPDIVIIPDGTGVIVEEQ